MNVTFGIDTGVSAFQAWTERMTQTEFRPFGPSFRFRKSEVPRPQQRRFCSTLD
jgi:hypothetical protein